MGNTQTGAEAVAMRNDLEAKLAQVKSNVDKLKAEYRTVPLDNVSKLGNMRTKAETLVARGTAYELKMAEIDKEIGAHISANKLVTVGDESEWWSGWMARS